MDWKKLGKALLFPHIAIMILLVPIATVLLVGSMVFVGTESVVAYVSYVIAAYTLTVWCVKIPYLIKRQNAYKNVEQDKQIAACVKKDVEQDSEIQRQQNVDKQHDAELKKIKTLAWLGLGIAIATWIVAIIALIL